jgi:hypothetical protein
MKGFKSFNAKSAIATATSMAVAGAGSAVVDWALAKYDVLPAEWGDTAVQAGKIVVGAIGGSMIKNQIAKSVFDGIATVAAAKLVAGMLPDDTADGGAKSNIGPSGLPEGTIGRIRLGQRGFRRGRVAGMAGADFMGC